MNKEFYIDEQFYGHTNLFPNCKYIYITGIFNNEIITEISNIENCILIFNYAIGCDFIDYEIIQTIPSNIVGIDILGFDFDFTYLYHLKKMKYFGFKSYTRNPIDFTQFPLLEDVFLEYWPQAKSIFECKNLRKLYISGFKTKNMDEFTKLTNLEELFISSTPIANLSSIEKLTKLKSLSLDFLTKLESLSGIEKLSELEELDIESMKKFPDINVVSKLTKLKKLGLVDCGEIESLKPISNLKELKSLFFTGDTKILDGDLDFLKTMNIERLSFANRKHYSLKREELFGYQNL